MNRIGERIKKKRELLNLQLNELAEKVGISSSALSQIEKSKSYPSLQTLKSIAENLHTSIGDLVGENESIVNHPVVFYKDMKYIDQNESGTSIYSISNHDVNKLMDAFLIRFEKASGLEHFFQNAHGQFFCHVLSGEVAFTLDSKLLLLKQGDSIYFNAKATFDAKNKHEGLSELLLVQSPPNFL